ncbi:TPA: hypothetical protein ACSE14_005381 [Escherichia coli]
MSTNTPTEINKLFTDPAHIELTKKTLTEITNALDEKISEIDKDKHFATYMALQMQSMAMVTAKQTISELYMKTLRLERELAELRAQMKTDESPTGEINARPEHTNAYITTITRKAERSHICELLRELIETAKETHTCPQETCAAIERLIAMLTNPDELKECA